MKTRAYNKLYLEDAMHNFGSMLNCAANVAHCDMQIFYEMFLSSGIASQMESGNPRYISGLSGMELMQLVFERTSDILMPDKTHITVEHTPEYWAGWALAYYQWYSSYSFSFIHRNIIDINSLLSLYSTLHEADLSKFVQIAENLEQQYFATSHSMLKTIRKQSCLTQRQLADLSGVTLRMIQAYEQGDQDIRKAEARTIFALSKVLGCSPGIICE